MNKFLEQVLAILHQYFLFLDDFCKLKSVQNIKNLNISACLRKKMWECYP